MLEKYKILPLSKTTKLHNKKYEKSLEKINVEVVEDDDDTSLRTSYVECVANQKTIDYYKLRGSYVRDEMSFLRKELANTKEEIKRIQSTPLSVGQFGQMVDNQHAIIHSNSGSTYFSKVLSTLDRETLKTNASIAMHRHSSAVVKVLKPHADSLVSTVTMTKKPDVTFSDIGGLETQKQEIREAVELPLTHGELYRSVGIDAPRGVLLYGPPGTGKTMMAKAVANATNATFINVVGSEFVQKYLGEGARMVRNVFQLAKENSTENGAIIFIDEIDAIGMARYDSSNSSDREVQRILLELLNQMDGFDQTTNIKIIMATNRPDTLDPALMRPGRLDRKIEFPMPDRRQRRMIYSVVTSKMSLNEDVDLESFVRRPQKISAADIASICAEAGLLAIRGNRYLISMKDFEEAFQNNIKRTDKKHAFYS